MTTSRSWLSAYDYVRDHPDDLDNPEIIERTEKSRLPLTELLFRMYAWHTIDALPVLDVWEVVKIRPTLKPADTPAQLLVLAYRLAVVGLGISALAQWLRIRKVRRTRARTQRSRG